jgi:hypothetical protein
VDFPFVEQAARLTRCIDRDRHPAQGIETEYRTSALSLAMLRRAALSVAIHWIGLQPPRRRHTTTFFNAMRAQQRRKAFSLVIVRHSNALHSS